uniref:Uncharacterized protein n=1 Tax=Arundo donax TaxID=35708 RepID=A0A0A8Y1P7_ARUDO
MPLPVHRHTQRQLILLRLRPRRRRRFTLHRLVKWAHQAVAAGHGHGRARR